MALSSPTYLRHIMIFFGAQVIFGLPTFNTNCDIHIFYKTGERLLAHGSLWDRKTLGIEQILLQMFNLSLGRKWQ